MKFLFLPMLVLAWVATARGGPAPEWLRAAAQVASTQGAAVPAVVLLDECTYAVQPNGHGVITHRYAIRVLNRSGDALARGAVDYQEKSDKVLAAEAWLLRGGQEVRPPKRRDWIDLTDAAQGAVFDEGRTRSVSFEDLAITGDVFGYETRVDRTLLFAQTGYKWENELPVVTERFVVTLPAGWTCTPLLTGPQAQAVTTSQAGQRWEWTLTDRPHRPDEPAMAERARLDARLMLTLRGGPANPGAPRAFGSWAEVADWDCRSNEAQCDSDPGLQATVQRLTAGCQDGLSRIRVLGRHVQQLRYVAVNKGLAQGMGYRPRKATEVSVKGWGDCKDKANLLRAMLREVGIESFNVSANIGGARGVDPAWPTPLQFNHAILAIRVEPTTTLPAVVDVAGLGRLLFFDPTDPDTLVGDVPFPLQGGRVHVLAPGNGALTELPVLPLESSHRFETHTELAFHGTGVIGRCRVGGPGRAGAVCRALARLKSEKDQRLALGETLSGTARGAQIVSLSAEDDTVSADRRVTFEFASPRFAQAMPGDLTLVRLDLLSRNAAPAFPEKQRTLPIGLPPGLYLDEVRLLLPDGTVVDDLPAPMELQSPFGRYTNAFEVVDGAVVSRRMLRMEERTVPVAEYAELRKFLGEVARADRSAVVLRRGAVAAVP